MSNFTNYVKKFFNGAYLYMLGALISLGVTFYLVIDISKDVLVKQNLTWINFFPIILTSVLTIILFGFAKAADADVEVDLEKKTVKINEKK